MADFEIPSVPSFKGNPHKTPHWVKETANDPSTASEKKDLPGPQGQDVPEKDTVLKFPSIYDKFKGWDNDWMGPTTAKDLFAENNFLGFGDNFLVINDIVLEEPPTSNAGSVPTVSISMESRNDVIVAETLRSQAPVVATRGYQDLTVSMTLIFGSELEQIGKLHRLVAELSHHPLAYIYSGKIRKALGIDDPLVQTIFILESGTIRNSEEYVGGIVLDLTFHHFNYKPFSNHFWYNQFLPGVDAEQSEKQKREEHLGAERDIDELVGYDSSSHSIGYQSEKIILALKAGGIKIGKDLPNTPINVPAGSEAWMHYANHLSEPELSPALALNNSDFVGFILNAYEYHAPPNASMNLGEGIIKDIYGGLNNHEYPPWAKIYDALSAPDNPEGTTASEKEATKASEEGQAEISGIGDPTATTSPLRYALPPNAPVIYMMDEGTDVFGTFKAKSQRANASAKRAHTGIDLTGQPGAPVRCPAKGRVIKVVKKNKRNNSLMIIHDELGGYVTWYMHCQDIFVKHKDPVQRGQVICTNGYSHSWHIHFEVLKPGVAEMDRAYRPPSTREFWDKRIDPEEFLDIVCGGRSKMFRRRLSKNEYTKRWHNKPWVGDLASISGGAVEPAGTGHMEPTASNMEAEKAGEDAATDQAKKKGVQHEQAKAKKLDKSDKEADKNPPPDEDVNPDAEPGKKPIQSHTKDATYGKQPKSGKDPAARATWISTMKTRGLSYYTQDPKVRNVFYRTNGLYISSDPMDNVREDPEFTKNMVCTGISLSFGHRIVPMKMVSQDTYTWQFLGAGNKTGTLVFTFSGTQGRAYADRFKHMVMKARENARQFSSLIPDAGSMQIVFKHPKTYEQNNILALLNLKHVIIIDVNEQSVPDQADLHQLVVNFISQEFASETLERSIITTFDTKRRIVRALMEFVVSEKIPDHLITPEVTIDHRRFYPNPEIIENRYHLAKEERDIYARTGQLMYGQGRPWLVKDSKMPTWLANAIINTSTLCRKANEEAPPTTWVANVATGGTWVNRYARWGAGDKIRGKVQNIHQDELNSAENPRGRTDELRYGGSPENEEDYDPENLLSVRSASATISEMYDHVFTFDGGHRTNGIHARVFNRWLDHMNLIVQDVQKHALDPAFGKYFGDIGNKMTQAAVQRMGECYADMHTPRVITAFEREDKDTADRGIPLPPEFYIYDDSREDPAMSVLTDDGSMEEMLLRHVKNQRSSVNRYIKDTLLGGSYVSRNLPRILENRRKYLEDFSGPQGDAGEVGFMTFSQMLSEGATVWDPVYYRKDDQNYKFGEGGKWIKRITTDAGATDNDDDLENGARYLFMDNLIKLSPYLKEGRPGWKNAYPGTNNDYMIETLYSENWKALTFGPNPDYAHVDDTMGGTPVTASIRNARNSLKGKGPEPGSDEPAESEPGEPGPVAQDGSEIKGIEPGEAGTITLGDGTAIGMSAPEVEEKPGFFERYLRNSLDNLAAVAAWGLAKVEGGSLGPKAQLIALTAGVALTSAQRKKAAEAKSKTSTEVLSKAEHTTISNKFNEDKEDQTLSSMAAGIAFGTKAKDLSIRRAYPTFKIYFIEDDDEEGEVVSGRIARAFDDFYSYSAIQEIRVSRSRKVAADLAVIRMANLGGTLWRKRFGENSEYDKYVNRKYGDDAEQAVGIFADTELENPFERMILQDGVKVQIRLGYASDPDHLETVFLGSIVEISPTDGGKILEIVCQGFGAELEGVELGPLEDGPVFFSSQQVLSGAIIQDSIVNFGRRSRFNKFTAGQMRHNWTGGVGENLGAGNLVQKWGQAQLYKHFYRYSFRNYPQDDNIYAPPPHVYAGTWAQFYNNACTYRPLKQTPWQIFKEHELRHPGYVSMAVPYGHSARMTMFFGAPGQHYWAHPPSSKEVFMSEQATDAIVRLKGLTNQPEAVRNKVLLPKMVKLAAENPELAGVIMKELGSMSFPSEVSVKLGEMFGRYRPFRNFHYFDSEHHILKNEIRTNKDGVFNEVEVLYFTDDGDIKDNDPEDLSSNLEALNRGDAGIMACKLDENIPEEYIRSYREEFPSCITDHMARRYIQGLFARILRDCYRGELIVLGEPTLKPYDVCYLNDTSINMAGPIEVESVEHIFNRDHGFISIITPDLCVAINDYYSASTMDLVGASLSQMFGLSSTTAMVALAGLASPLGLLAVSGGVKFIKWTQEGVPVVTTPLVVEGKPFMSVSLGQKRTSLFLAEHGKWTQYWDDLSVAWNKYDFAESAFTTGVEWQEKMIGFLGGIDVETDIPVSDF